MKNNNYRKILFLAVVLLFSAVGAISVAQIPAPQPAPALPATPTVVVIPSATEGTSAATEPATTIPIQVVTAPPAMTEEQKVALEEQKNIVSRLPGPNDLIDYFRSKCTWRQYESAYACIDFDTKNIASEKNKRHTIYTLNFILNRLDPKGVSDFPTGETIMVQNFDSSRGLIELEFVRGEHNNWKFSQRTIWELDRYYALLRDEPPIRFNWLINLLPSWVFAPVLGTTWFRIIILVTAFFLGFFLKYLVEWFLYRLSRWLLNLVLSDWDKNKLTRKTWMPMGLLVLFSFWLTGLYLFTPTAESFDFFQTLYIFFAVTVCVWMSFRIVDLFSLWLRQKMRHRDPNIDIIFFPLFTRTVKILLVCFGLMTFAELFHWSLVGLISGFGIGGIAIAFAAKETIANLFGSVTVLADRPFVIGDWIKTGDIEGTVESVGMRSTRIRTFYNSLVTVPNNNLTTAVIDNMGARYYRRYRTFLSVPLDTEPERIEAFCEGIRELIRRHPYTRKDLFHVFLHEFQPSSLDILLNVFFVCPDSAIEFRERGRFIADILRLAKELGIRFALPSQTIFNKEPSSGEIIPIGDDPITLGRSAAIKIYPLDD
jgi:small-conductance mechanosensitive channel